MSRTKQILEISAPNIKSTTEHLEGAAQKCNYCSGNGWFWGVDEFGQNRKDPCPICGGTGVLKPLITIEWKRTEK